MKITSKPEVEAVFRKYPDMVKRQMQHLRNLVLTTANDLERINQLEETLRWGEPSYITKIGSTVRMDWKAKKPEQFALYFKCTSQLVPTFKTIYGDLFTYEGNRALVFGLDDKIPEKEVKHCIAMALQYHKLKHLPLLGA